MKLDENSPLVEELAALEHASWARWMSYLFSQCIQDTNNQGLIIPWELVRRWDRQAATPYEGLTEKEKESDRKEVRLILPVLEKVFWPEIVRNARTPAESES